MRLLIALAATTLLTALPLFFVTTSLIAGAEKIAFPQYQTHVLYDVLDQPENKEIRELYINREALQKFRPNTPLPYDTVLTAPTFKALLDEKGEFVRDTNGRLIRGRLDRVVVMEKRKGWGSQYPIELRNGEWEYGRFGADGKLSPNVNYNACFQCHKPKEKQDFVFSHDQLIKAAGRPR